MKSLKRKNSLHNAHHLIDILVDIARNPDDTAFTNFCST